MSTSPAAWGVSVRTVERYMADALYLCHCALRRDGALP